MLQKQQPTAGPPKGSGLLTPPGEADYFKGGGLMKTVQQSVMRQKMHSTPISQLSTLDSTKATLREGSPNLLQMASKGVGKRTTSESMDSRSRQGMEGFNKGYLLPAKVTVV